MKNFTYGLHSSLAAIQQHAFHIQEVYLLAASQNKRIANINNEISEKNIPHQVVSKKELEQLCGDRNHQGVVVIFKNQRATSEADLLEYCAHTQHPVLLLVLDQIVDPHNLGACMRTAEAAGANAVISSAKKSVSITPTVRKVSCGASERIPFILAKNLTRYLKELKQIGIWIYGTQPQAEKLIYEADFCRSVALVIGAEGGGMRRLTADTCDELLAVPMSGEMASLNASVATGIGLFEAVRQRNAAN